MRGINEWPRRFILALAIVDSLALGAATGVVLSDEGDAEVSVVIREQELPGDLRVCRKGLEAAAGTITIVRQAMIELNEGVPEFTAELVHESYQLQDRFRYYGDRCASLLRGLLP